MVRDTLGENAIIVATREERGGKTVCVTAAIEPAFEIGRGGATAEDWLQYDSEDEENAIVEELTEAMIRHGVPEDVLDNVVSCASVIGLDQPGVALVAAIEHLFHFRPLPVKPYAKAMMLVGAPGSGKTLAAAKIAARGVMNGQKIGVVTTDTVRAGGVEQLQAFTKLLQIPLQRAKTPEDLVAILKDLKGCDQIVVDMAGVNPFDTADMKTLAKFITKNDVAPHLVLPAGGDSEEAGEMARIFAAVGVDIIMPTRIDITRRLGGLLSAAHYGRMSFTDAGNTPKVADGLMSLTPVSLARLLMPSAYRDQTPPDTIRPTGTQRGTRQ